MYSWVWNAWKLWENLVDPLHATVCVTLEHSHQTFSNAHTLHAWYLENLKSEIWKLWSVFKYARVDLNILLTHPFPQCQLQAWNSLPPLCLGSDISLKSHLAPAEAKAVANGDSKACHSHKRNIAVPGRKFPKYLKHPVIRWFYPPKTFPQIEIQLIRWI